jgi:hypothetical protein|mmetsp:Transcript_7933/g.12998  ORF Transcript_7933/g.12998 Transcript_7933/m.12998 type:complete len:545 (+) Transcript_7933:93-1727(+)
MSLAIHVALHAFVFASATEFLKGGPKYLHESLSEEEVKSSLLQEIEGTLGAGSATRRLDELEALLKPIYSALPKNEYGKLGHAAGRYALNRLFVMRHGWKINGIASKSGSWNGSSPAGVLKDQVPEYVQSIFEQRLGGHGLGLYELAILASTLEHLIHTETSSKLGATFHVHNLSPNVKLDETLADDVLDTYVMAYIVGESLANMSLAEAQSLKAEMPGMFIAWKNTQAFVRRIRADVASNSEIDFNTMTKIADAVGEQFGSFFSTQCLIMKEKMMSLGDGGRGRVMLSDFYRSHLDGSWQFQESVSYLRQLGALDESDPKAMSVVIPNYINSQTNCIPSGFYSICCKDECEGLLGHLEAKLATPEATPEAIIRIVAELASSTMPAPVKISSVLTDQLTAIAEGHGGMVPLHGRLFAQWMHHVYPRECPFPHISGTTSQQAPDEWMIESGSDPLATQEEMLQFGEARNLASGVKNATFAEMMPWSLEEELLVVCTAPSSTPTQSPKSSSVRGIVLFVAIMSVAFGLLQNLKAVPSATLGNKIFV